jgi:hypothetical protein
VKFEGSLDAFSLPDIFQLLSFTKKSGGLRLRHGRGEGVVWFVDGFVTGATSDIAHQALARRVAGLGLASPEAFRQAVETSARSGGTVGVARALLDAGAVDADHLRATVTAAATDAVSELLRWPTGDFTLVDLPNPDDVGVVLPSDTIVTQAAERATAWQSLAEILPSPDVVLVLWPAAPDADSVLTPEEWSLLALVDGRRSVGAIVALTGRGQFSVVSTLAELVRRGLLHPKGAQDPVAELEATLSMLAPLESGVAAAARTQPDPGPVEPPHGPTMDEWAAASTQVDEVAHGAADDPADHPAGDAAENHQGSEPDAPHAGPFSATPPPDRPDVVELGSVADVEPSDPVVADLDLDSVDTPPLLTLALSRVDSNTEAEPSGAVGDDDSDEELEHPAVLPRLGGAHVPGDVIPPRAEPFLPSRQPEHPETMSPIAARLAGLSSVPSGASVGNAAIATDPQSSALIERDPSVNRSLLLRLIAGVRGL